MLATNIRACDATFLAVLPGGAEYLEDGIRFILDAWWCGDYICPEISGSETPENLSGRLVPSYVDFRLVRRWLQYCQTEHSGSCHPAINVSLAKELGALKLIDCNKWDPEGSAMNLVFTTGHLESTGFAALSYVWGPPRNKLTNAANTSGASRENDIPRIIKDAIAVTKELGLRYLWIDRFCIDQENADEKHRVIRNMDIIYSGAQITIVAAAGEDDDFGLFGVSKHLPRKTQRSTRVRDGPLVSIMKHPHDVMRRSKWATRGWTYQEEFFSKRRLVFTKDQVYFECNSVQLQESVSLPLHRMCVERIPKLTFDVPEGTRLGIESILAQQQRSKMEFAWATPRTQGRVSRLSPFGQYFNHLRDYTERNLTFDSDSINAFRGFMRHFFHQPDLGLSQFYGLPFDASNGAEMKRTFVFSLTWYHDVRNSGEKAQNQLSPRRREQFPSWSWAGWEGGIDIKWLDPIGFETQFLDIFFVEPGLVTRDFQDYASKWNVWSGDRLLSRFVIHGRVIPEETWRSNPKLRGPEVKDWEFHLSKSSDDAFELFRTGIWVCILLGAKILTIGPRAPTPMTTYLMILEPVQTTSKASGKEAERAGIVWILGGEEWLDTFTEERGFFFT